LFHHSLDLNFGEWLSHYYWRQNGGEIAAASRIKHTYIYVLINSSYYAELQCTNAGNFEQRM
jgi:hypothetical protein